MAIVPQAMAPTTVYYHDTTTNQSFMKMHYFLKAKGIKNNKFFLLIYDPGLMGINPRDPNLTRDIKLRILRECMINFWYFSREIVNISEEGGTVGGGKRYELSRANLALNYMFVYNINVYLELPRQFGKTVSSLVWYLWIFNFGATNTKIMFANQKHEKSKANLATLKTTRAALPEYLRMESVIGPDGKQVRVPNTVETLQNPINKNTIITLPGARTPSLAESAGRGATVAIQYYDEFAFLPYNDIVYAAAIPAFSKASENAAKNGVPYGLLITSTPGDLTTREGQFANKVRLNATEWDESFYDLSYQQLKELIDSNPNSNFVYIKYTYQMLGRGADYFDKMVKELQKDWPKIRREVLLEWAKTADNSPFNKEDLDIIEGMVSEQPRSVLRFGKAGQFVMKFWDTISPTSNYPPIVGVDVASGGHKDYSTITVIDSQTTKVIATMKSNFITTPELADVIYQFVSTYAKNAIVNIENNGIGAPVLQMLLKTSIKRNLYYEIKDRVLEENYDGVAVQRKARKCKVYGSTSSFQKRSLLIELLHQRVQHHRDKFLAKDLYDELCTMVVKPNGKTEHADDAHDDLIFSYLWALYVFYHGEDLATRFHLMKTEIMTDDNYDETSYLLEEEYDEYEDIDQSVFKDDSDESSKMIEEQMKIINSNKTITLEDLYKRQMLEDEAALNKIKQTPYGREAISKAYSISLESLEKESKSAYVDIGSDVMKMWYGNDGIEENPNDIYKGNLGNMFKRIQ